MIVSHSENRGKLKLVSTPATHYAAITRIMVVPQNLALLLPDWDSLDSVRKARSFLELWAIWLFAALVVWDEVDTGDLHSAGT